MKPASAQRRQQSRTGRPRDAELTDRFRLSALTIVAERGFKALNTDTLAGHARAGKGGLYLRWSNMSELVADALNHQRLVPVVSDTGSLRGDLLLLFDPFTTVLNVGERAAGAIAGTARFDETLRVALRTTVLEPLSGTLSGVLDRHQCRGNAVEVIQRPAIQVAVRALWCDRYIQTRPPATVSELDVLVQALVRCLDPSE